MHLSVRTALAGMALIGAFSLGPTMGPSIAEASSKRAMASEGSASYYGGRFHGRRTANGERFNMHQMTAAHRTLPFGTKVKVTNTRTGKAVVVRINDRGPFHGNRIIDLSQGAAGNIGMIKSGVARVKLEVVR